MGVHSVSPVVRKRLPGLPTIAGAVVEIVIRIDIFHQRRLPASCSLSVLLDESAPLAERMIQDVPFEGRARHRAFTESNVGTGPD